MGSVKVPPTAEYGMAIGMINCDQCFVKDNLTALVGTRAKTNEGMGKEGMTWPAIVDGGSVGMKARVALAMECLGHLLATMMLTVGSRGL